MGVVWVDVAKLEVVLVRMRVLWVEEVVGLGDGDDVAVMLLLLEVLEVGEDELETASDGRDTLLVGTALLVEDGAEMEGVASDVEEVVCRGVEESVPVVTVGSTVWPVDERAVVELAKRAVEDVESTELPDKVEMPVDRGMDTGAVDEEAVALD